MKKLLVHNSFLFTVMGIGNILMNCAMFLLQQGPVLQLEQQNSCAMAIPAVQVG